MTWRAASQTVKGEDWGSNPRPTDYQTTNPDRSGSAGLSLSHNEFRSPNALLYPVDSRRFAVIIGE
jgi:hypothetical protein